MGEMQAEINALKTGLSRMELRQERFDINLETTNKTLARIDKNLEEISRDLKKYVPIVNENKKWIGIVQKIMFWIVTSVVCAGLGRIAWGMFDSAVLNG